MTINCTILQGVGLGALALAACAETDGAPGTRANDRAARETVVVACDEGRRARGCDLARRRLAAARRQERMAFYGHGQ